LISGAGCSGDASTSALKNQRHKVAGYEDISVVFWAKARCGGVVYVDDAGQAQVDRCGQEGWTESDADEVPVL
jgi:hypothetical protein